MPYRSSYAPAIADLLRDQGQTAARAQLQRGQAWGGAVQNIGQQVKGTLASLLQEKQDAPRRAMQDEMGRLQINAGRREEAGAQVAAQEAAALKQARTPEEIFAAVGPERGAKYGNQAG